MADKTNTILVVDDTPTNLEMMVAKLSAAGYVTTAAISGERALSRLEHYLPDLILLDVYMPGLDGFAVCKRLKADPRTAAIPVIFLTAATDTDSITQGFAVGAVDYISKPFQDAELLARIQTHLELNTLQRRLEQRVENRTRELQSTLDQLQQANQSLSLTQFSIDHASDSIFWFNAEGRILYANQTAAHRLGYTLADLLTQSVMDVDPSLSAATWAETWQRLRRDHSFTVESEYQGQDHQRHPVELQVNYLVFNGQEYAIAVARDIRDRKQVEQVLKDANLLLEKRVTERTAELTAAKEQAEAANRSKGLFLAKMSHELRTPLNAILGFSELMSRDPTLASHHTENLRIISHSGSHLLTLINDILEMSKLEAGQINYQPERFNLMGLLEAVVQMLQLKANSKGLGFSTTYAPHLPAHVETDSHKLRQVLVNLLGNAIKFTQRGYVALRVEGGGEEEMAATTILRFVVEDTGCGIAAEDLNKLFQPFVQTVNGLAAQEGTGLGLAISRQFVHLLGGDLSVDSEVGRGSIFSFTVPVGVVRDRPLAPLPNQQRAIALAPGQPQYRILVVEDNWTNRALLQSLLTNLGFLVDSAADGAVAVERWAAWHPHLILMDVRMPCMDGYTATRQIRQRQAAAYAPPGLTSPPPTTVLAPRIVALTTEDLVEERKRAIAAGCDAVLPKPVEAAPLTQVLAQQLGVKYEYELAPPNTNDLPPTPAMVLTPSIFKTLPPDWLQQFYNALLHLDQDAMLELIQQLPPTQGDLARTLSQCVHNFDYELLLERIQQANV